MKYTMEDLSIPATLNETVFSEPLWLQAWVMLLVIANIAAAHQLNGWHS